MPKAPENLREFTSLLKVVEQLRGPEGCPWDKEQTHQTLTRYAIEEAFELSEAIDLGQPRAICDELGDVLLQVVLHSEIARQSGSFDIYDVIQNLNEKMVRRHSHVFVDGESATNSAEVVTRWADVKAKEKGRKPGGPLSFDIPIDLPALLRSQKIGEKTGKVGFDWNSAEECWPKVHEEVAELRVACDSGERSAIEGELGDVLFSLAQLARHLALDCEQALRKTNQRFEARFVKMQTLVAADGKEWAQLGATEKESYWKRAKV